MDNELRNGKREMDEMYKDLPFIQERVFDKANGLVRLTMDKRTANALAVLLSKLSITDLNALRLGAEVNQLDAVYLLLRAKLQKLESNAPAERRVSP